MNNTHDVLNMMVNKLGELTELVKEMAHVIEERELNAEENCLCANPKKADDSHCSCNDEQECRCSCNDCDCCCDEDDDVIDRHVHRHSTSSHTTIENFKDGNSYTCTHIASSDDSIGIDTIINAVPNLDKCKLIEALKSVGCTNFDNISFSEAQKALEKIGAVCFCVGYNDEEISDEDARDEAIKKLEEMVIENAKSKINRIREQKVTIDLKDETNKSLRTYIAASIIHSDFDQIMKTAVKSYLKETVGDNLVEILEIDAASILKDGVINARYTERY